MTVSEVQGWIWPRNVRTALEHISALVGYSFDDWDWTAVETALPHTSWDPPERWYDYPIVGTQTLTVHLANDDFAHPVAIRVHGELDEVLTARIDTIIHLLSDVIVTES